MSDRSLTAFSDYLASLRPTDADWPESAVITPEAVTSAYPHALTFALDHHRLADGWAFPVFCASQPSEAGGREVPSIGWIVQGKDTSPVLPWRPVVSRRVGCRSGQHGPGDCGDSCFVPDVQWADLSRGRQALASFLALRYAETVEIVAGFLNAIHSREAPEELLARLVHAREELECYRELSGEAIVMPGSDLRIYLDSARVSNRHVVTVAFRFETRSDTGVAPQPWDARLDLDDLRFLDTPPSGHPARKLIQDERGHCGGPFTRQVAAIVRQVFAD